MGALMLEVCTRKRRRSTEEPGNAAVCNAKVLKHIRWTLRWLDSKKPHFLGGHGVSQKSIFALLRALTL